MQVSDESHRNMILTAIQQLCHRPEVRRDLNLIGI